MKNTYKDQFSKILKTKREAIKMTQKELADKVGVTQQCISEWESSSTSPTLKPLWLISDIFDITVDELIGKKSS